ncbi:hypothetical protein VTI74DRAFT_3515 [Chaetomium olivicolor]
MASLLPLIQDILPMILPASVIVTKAADILPPRTGSGEPETKVEELKEASNQTPQDAWSKGASNGISNEAPKVEPDVQVISRNAMVGKTDRMCASVLIVKPRSSTSVRHHGEQEAMVYAVSGNGVLFSQPKGDKDVPERHEFGAGDFAFIPAWTEHQLVNESESDFHLVLFRSGGEPVEVNLADWGGREVKTKSKN